VNGSTKDAHRLTMRSSERRLTVASGRVRLIPMLFIGIAIGAPRGRRRWAWVVRPHRTI
jgi:hypothetical protein